MKLIAHTASNTEIVCALGMAHTLIGVDADSDYPPEVVNGLPKLGRDLAFDAAAVAALKPDLVLTSLTVPGHEKVVAELRATGIPVFVADPVSLSDVYADIRAIAGHLDAAAAGEALIASMQAAMPTCADTPPVRIGIEWWPKPAIVATGRSWINDLLQRAGASNPWAHRTEKSAAVTPEEAVAAQPEAMVISWCGVDEANYRVDKVLNRPGWATVPAVRHQHVYPITEAHLGRPGPRLVEGYRRIRAIVERVRQQQTAAD
ncbi:helical backbone metal receptor [Algiphilus sp.]|uniref:ABC transporter substrate-binding protein n=1 Tax=Algiphilus sp. TaxID=1872431 RepID=UPI002A68632D|nr:helical backbone metal receptor [Pseudomonadota bacterium]